MEKKFNFVYVTTNLINGKQYVGDHSTNNLNDGYLGSGHLIKYAIRKYGKENFKCEILESFETKQEAFNVQEKYISQFKTLKPEGYNISPKGGHNVKGGFSEESLEKMSKNRSGIEPWNKGKINIYSEETKIKMRKPKSDETKKKFSKIHTGQIPWNKNKNNSYSDDTLKKMRNSASTRLINGFSGKHHTELTKEKIKEALKNTRNGSNNPNAKINDIQLIEIKMLLDKNIDMKIIAKNYNVTSQTIYNIKCGKRK